MGNTCLAPSQFPLDSVIAAYDSYNTNDLTCQVTRALSADEASSSFTILLLNQSTNYTITSLLAVCSRLMKPPRPLRFSSVLLVPPPRRYHSVTDASWKASVIN